ncbi:MAG: cytochrome d ubiquinol oxidase subunit II [Bacteroidota bacterium]|nr:cytochrome d ubiquinol oxidase subunit II [Bacteroidota bacterium]
MLYIVIGFLCVAVLFYLLFGGADFGAGIIELFTSNKNKKLTRMLTYKAIGPIWEANHMWLIITIVILFVGFPKVYYVLSVNLHIPLVIMLLGIVARGTAFIFRHYDAVVDDMQKLYNLIFVYSSFITPLFMGIITGSLISGNIDPGASDFIAAYVQSWFQWFPLSVGLFTVSICGFLAAVYLVGESTETEDQIIFILKARVMNILTVLAGGLVFFTSEMEGIYLFGSILGKLPSLIALILATVSLFVLWEFLGKRRKVLVRLIAGFQVTMILFTFGNIYLPDLIVFSDGSTVSLLEHAAIGGPINTLGWSLIIGSIFILPSLYYLVWSFQKNPLDVKHEVE